MKSYERFLIFYCLIFLIHQRIFHSGSTNHLKVMWTILQTNHIGSTIRGGESFDYKPSSSSPSSFCSSETNAQVRLYCSLIIEYDIHTLLDLATLISTLWVIYMMRFKLNSSYTKELDNMPRYYAVVPSFVLAIFIHPFFYRVVFGRIFWAFCVYLEAVSVLPQLRLMQNSKLVEPFTAHYVFALGVARFLGFAHWIIQANVIDPADMNSHERALDQHKVSPFFMESPTNPFL